MPALLRLLHFLWTFFARDSAEALAAAQQRAQMAGSGKKESSLLRAAKEIQYWKLLMFAGTFAIANTAIASFLPTYFDNRARHGRDGCNDHFESQLAFRHRGLAARRRAVCADVAQKTHSDRRDCSLYFGWLRHPICFVLGADRGAGACGGRTVFYSVAAQSTIMIETSSRSTRPFSAVRQTSPPASGSFLCVIVSFLFQGVAAASSMTVAYRVFFALCLIGLLGAILLRETGKKTRKKHPSDNDTCFLRRFRMNLTPEMILRGYQANTAALEEMIFLPKGQGRHRDRRHVEGSASVWRGGCVRAGQRSSLASSTQEKGISP